MGRAEADCRLGADARSRLTPASDVDSQALGAETIERGMLVGVASDLVPLSAYLAD
jgi:hypothetical protein